MSPAVSLRARLMRLTAICLSLVLLSAFLGTALILNQREEALIDQLLDEQLEADIDQYTPDGGLGPVGVPRMQFYAFVPGQPDEKMLPAYFRDYGPGNHSVETDSTEYHFVIRDENGRRFLLAYDVEQYENSFTELMLILGAAFLVAMILSVSVIYVLGRRALSNIEKLAAAVQSPSEDAFVQPDMEAEVLALAGALDDYRARQSLLLEREQEFSAHLSHELRTPLSVVRAQAELIQMQHAADVVLSTRAVSIMDQVDRMRQLIEQLLRLARSQRSPERRAVPLRELVERIWSELAQSSVSATRLDNQLQAAQDVQADPLLLELILRNVMANARLHANGSLLSVSLDEKTLVLEDIGEELRVSQHAHSGNGQGIGLSILERASRLLGWGYAVTSTAKGTRVAITLR
ncbi:MAG: sensor histidine kinase [Moraxellaceae bacterium]